MRDWKQLLSLRRLGKDAAHSYAFDGRNDFQRDFDRLVFSGAFRRLQNKTQVVPLPESDFVHTRLTHSIEASCVGRSLGHITGKRILKDIPGGLGDITEYDFEAIVAAACLAHDFGNPPFGHSGEKAISEYFKSPAAEKYIANLTSSQRADLQNFEGNAAGFRLLTHSQPGQNISQGGMGLTAATLGVFTKYPKGSYPGTATPGKASEKKYGYFHADKAVFAEIAALLGLGEKHGTEGAWFRHPLSFLVEAADDICYQIIDLEDGYKMKLVGFAETRSMLEAVITSGGNGTLRVPQNAGKAEVIGYLRAKAINALVQQAADIFTAHKDGLLSGAFDSELLSLVPAAPALAVIKDVSTEHIYNSTGVVEVEVAGFEVLSGLLDAFLGAAFDQGSSHNRKLKQLLPLYIFDGTAPDPYTSILNVTMYISGMTDTFAIETYRKIKGITIPGMK